MPENVIPAEYFSRDTVSVARDLLGHHLVRELPDGTVLKGRIVETEAYTQDDPAFHGWDLWDRETGELVKEGQGAALFAAPGTAYVYLCYGIHWLFNVVTEPEGTGGAVLVRAVEPIAGMEEIRSRRGNLKRERDLTNGPGKLTEALGIDDEFHGKPLDRSPLYLAFGEDDPDRSIQTSSRIGISKAVERPWRFFLESRYVSRGTPSNQKS